MTVVVMSGQLPTYRQPLTKGHVRRDLARGGILLDWINERYPATDEPTEHQLDVFCAALLGEVLQPPQDLVSQVARWVQTHLDQDVSLDDLAAHVGLSRYHFLRRFRAETGTTPMRFVRRKRIARLSPVTLDNLPLQLIADQVGLFRLTIYVDWSSKKPV